MSKKSAAVGLQVRSVELTDDRRAELQQVFLDAFLKMHKFAVACRAVKNAAGLPDGTTDEFVQAMVGQWVEEDTEFRVEFDKAKKAIDRVRLEKSEEFLADVGSGEKKTGKEHGLTQANVVAAHMNGEALDKQKWNPKSGESKNLKRKILITEYEVARPDTGKATTVEITEGEFKQLPPGSENDD
jgi:hypothetical protein